MIRQLTGWPWHACRTQACLLGLLKPHVHHEWTPELDEILESGYEIGGKAKEEAIKRIQAQTGWPRHVCWNRARKLGLAQVHPRKWTEDEDKYLLDFVSSKNLREIAKRLKRTVAAVRKRLVHLGGERKFSARVTDGHTKSELAQYLSCSRKTIQRWIDEGLLKGRYEGRNREDDTLRITDEDFRALLEETSVGSAHLSSQARRLAVVLFCDVRRSSRRLLRRSAGPAKPKARTKAATAGGAE